MKVLTVKLFAVALIAFCFSGCAAYRIYTPVNLNEVFRDDADPWTHRVAPVVKVSFHEEIPTDPFLEADAAN